LKRSRGEDHPEVQAKEREIEAIEATLKATPQE
jgi:hypothetical protein